jgi:hypothetical protein
VSEGPFPKTIKEAVPWVTWGAVVFTFFLVFVEKLVEGLYGQTLFALIGGLVVTAVALHSKTWLQNTNPNWAFAVALALLFAVISVPWVEQKKWPFSAWFYDSTPAEARESTLIEWLQQAQRERDDARQGVEATAAHKATLIEWLQTAERERDRARQELDQLQKQMQDVRLRAPSAIPIPTQQQPNPQVCVELLRLLSAL